MAFDFVKRPSGAAKLVGKLHFTGADSEPKSAGTVLMFEDGTMELCTMLFPVNGATLTVEFLDPQVPQKRYIAALLDTPAGHARIEIGWADLDGTRATLNFLAIPERGSRIVM